MPISQNKPNARVIRDYYRNRGQQARTERVEQSIDTTSKTRRTSMEARRQAKRAEMLAGVCK